MANKKFFSWFLALIILLGTFFPIFAKENNNEKIKYLIDKGWVEGHDDGDLALDENITRAQFTKLVVLSSSKKLDEKIKTTSKNKFSDVSDKHWATDYINKAVENGLIEGYPDQTFRPDSNITYGEILAILARINPKFKKARQATRPWYKEYVEFADENDYLLDIEDLDYGQDAIRARVFEILYNYYMSIEKQAKEEELEINYKKHRTYQIAISGEGGRDLVNVAEAQPLLEIEAQEDLGDINWEKAKSFNYFDKRTIDAVFEHVSLNLVNELRQEKSLEPLSYSDILQDGANKRAQELLDYGNIRVDGIAHLRPDGSIYTTAFEYINDTDYELSYIGENLAMVSNLSVSKDISASQLASKIANIFFQGWKNSPQHLKNILSPNYTKLAHSIQVQVKDDPKNPDHLVIKAIGVQSFGDFKNLIYSNKVNLLEEIESSDLRINLRNTNINQFINQIKTIDFKSGQKVAINMAGNPSKGIVDLASMSTDLPMILHGDPDGYMILEYYRTN